MTDTPWPNDAGVLERTPDRRPFSVRRTLTIDGCRPGGAFGDVLIEARGRDLLTDGKGAPVQLAFQHLSLAADFVRDQSVRTVEADPVEPGLQRLIGVPSRHGFRRAVAELLPERRYDGSLLMAALDDIPIVTAISRTALVRRGVISMRPADANFLSTTGAMPAKVPPAVQIECAGWAPGTSLSQLAERTGGPGYLTAGMPSPPVLRADDLSAWHPVPELGPDDFRRWRRMDIWTDEATDLVHIDAWWRDVYVAVDGTQRVQHEYSIFASVDMSSQTVKSIQATPRALPAPECSNAAPSPQVLIGTPLAEIGSSVRSLVHGIESCTHLTDTLRGIADVEVLARPLFS